MEKTDWLRVAAEILDKIVAAIPEPRQSDSRFSEWLAMRTLSNMAMFEKQLFRDLWRHRKHV